MLRRLAPIAPTACDGSSRVALHRQSLPGRCHPSADACGQRALPGPGPGQEADPCNEKLIINPLFALPLGVGESEGESGCQAPFERMAFGNTLKARGTYLLRRRGASPQPDGPLIHELKPYAMRQPIVITIKDPSANPLDHRGA